MVSLHDLCLKYSSCFFGSFPLGHFIIDNICHRPAAALFDVNLGPEELGDQDKITSDSEKLSLVSTALCTLRNSLKTTAFGVLIVQVKMTTFLEGSSLRNIERRPGGQCQIIIFLSNTELDEKQVFDNNRSVLPPPSPITPLLVK